MHVQLSDDKEQIAISTSVDVVYSRIPSAVSITEGIAIK